MADTKTLLGKRIRYFRRTKGLSQEELAEKANISSKYLGEIERGKANLTIEITEKISIALNIEISLLFDYQHEMGRKALKDNINSLIRKANDKDLQTIFRVLKSVLK